jgi:predicted O-methyltransferase YrrM
MIPRLTRRRVFGGVLLLLGALLLVVGTWQQNWRFLGWGIACWIAALLGLGVLVVQRANAVMQVCALNRADILQFMELQKKGLKLATDLKAPLVEQAEKLKRHAGKLDRLSSDLEALCNQLLSDQSAAASWRQDHYEHIATFRRQFADFVASVAEWMAIAEAEAKKGVADLTAEGASAIGAGVETLLYRFDHVDSVLSNVHDAAQGVPAAIEVNARGREVVLEAVKSRLDAINDGVTAVQRTSARINETAASDSERIKIISKTVQSILPVQRTEMARTKIEAVKEVEAILQLQSFLAPDKPMPLLGGWAMEPVSMLGVVTELVAREPALVLECGCGTSTLWIARTLQHIGKGRIVSLEHLEEYHAATSRALLAAGLEDWVDLLLAPLRTHDIRAEQFEWYDLGLVDLLDSSVDFLVIDGPPSTTGALARYPALPLLERMLADEAVIILDDANRLDEVEEVARWLKEYPGLRQLGEVGERTKMFAYSISGRSKRRRSARLQAL